MVMRTFEIKELSYIVTPEQVEEILTQLNELYGDELEISVERNEVIIRGDLHNYRRRERILWILSGGEHGSNVSAG